MLGVLHRRLPFHLLLVLLLTVVAIGGSINLIPSSGIAEAATVGIRAVSPTYAASNVPRNTTVRLHFYGDISASAVREGFSLRDSEGRGVQGQMQYNPSNGLATFTPSRLLDSNETYRARYTFQPGYTSILGDSVSWSFTTESGGSAPPPTATPIPATPTPTPTQEPVPEPTKPPSTPPPAGSLEDSGPITISGKSGVVIENLRITSSTGPCLIIRNSSNITVRNSEIGTCRGNGIIVDGSSQVNILDSYIHPEFPVGSCCDKGNGIFAFRSSDLLIQGNVVAYGESNVELLGVSNARVIGNYLLNPLGPSPRGAQVQVWSHTSQRSSNILVESNYAVASRSSQYRLPEGQVDGFNFGKVDGVIVRNNYMTGGRHPAGCGMIADVSANRVQFLSNTLVNTGQCGIGIASGTNQVIDGNRIYTHGLEGNVGNVAIYTWNQYSSPCGPVEIRDNIAVLVKPDGSTRYTSIWNGGGCGNVSLVNNRFGGGAVEALTPVEEKLPPPAAAPPRPYSSQTVNPYLR